MKSESYEQATEEAQRLEELRESIRSQINEHRSQLEDVESRLYHWKTRELHIRRIYQLASKEFPRLRRDEDGRITADDVAELEKWIGRAKGPDGLKDIVEALTELQKYRPVDIKSNLYALVQRIIIGGAYHQTKRRKKR
jgi:hypothetical protein